MLDEEHGDEGEDNEDRTEEEEDVTHTDEIVQQPRQDGGYDLGGHGRS